MPSIGWRRREEEEEDVARQEEEDLTTPSTAAMAPALRSVIPPSRSRPAATITRPRNPPEPSRPASTGREPLGYRERVVYLMFPLPLVTTPLRHWVETLVEQLQWRWQNPNTSTSLSAHYADGQHAFLGPTRGHRYVCCLLCSTTNAHHNTQCHQCNKMPACCQCLRRHMRRSRGTGGCPLCRYRAIKEEV